MTDNGRSGKVSRFQEAAIVGLLTEPTIEQAARRAGVSERTLYRWLRSDERFAAEYRRHRGVLLEGVVLELQRAGVDAVDTLRRNLTAESESVQVRAAMAILDYLLKSTELTDVSRMAEELLDREHEGAA